MTEFFAQGGIVMYPLVAVGLGVIWHAARSARLIGQGAVASPELHGSLQGIVFWGTFAAVLGLLGTSIGVIQMAQAVTLARGVEPYLVWGGFGVALITLIFGMVILLVAGLLWFTLRTWMSRRARGTGSVTAA
jgi:uncharacterized membrane protein YjfL (UPF0719 family)